MLTNTFCIINGIGERLEKKLWRSGIVTWRDFLETSDINFISSQKKNSFDKYLTSAQQKLDDENAEYFAATIKRREHWRLFEIFRGEAVCLDIETNGFMPGNGGYATVVGLYDGYDYKSFIKGENLTGEILKKELSRYKYLITFYGAGFDIPFLLRAMPELRFDIPHFDICFGSKRTGFKGGLKKLEAELGIQRDENVRNFDGYYAIKLWEQAQKGSSDALELLIAYNREDTVNLYSIADIIYQRLREQTGIEEYLSH
jgi:uncharacterized protein YprB with RNaseH-like and TPR domain